MKQHFLLLKVVLFTLLANILFAANTPYSYSYTPKFLYSKQLFPVTILAKHYNPKDPPHFEYDSLNLIQPINYKPIKALNKNEAFYTFYFKTPQNQEQLTIPTLTIWNQQYTYILHTKTIPIHTLKGIDNKHYSNLLASNLRVNSIRVDTYDTTNSLVTLDLEATEANMEDFHIPNVSDDGIENIQRDGARVTANYYFVTPSKKQTLRLSYYNLIKNRFSNINLNLASSSNFQKFDELNPKELNFDTIKKYTLMAIVVLFLLLAYTSRDHLYLILSAVLIALLVYFYIPNRSICIPEGTSLYILPTNNSNIITQIDQEYTAALLKQYRNFDKIDYKGLKGWVKNENICKN